MDLCKLPFQVVVAILLGLVFLGCDRAVDLGSSNSKKPASPTTQTEDLTQPELGPSGSGPVGQLGGQDEFKLKEPNIVAPKFDELGSKPTDKVEIRLVEFKKSSDPGKMMENILEIDRSIDRLLISNQQKEQESFRDNAITLAKMKLESGKFMAGLPNLSEDQARFATRTQLVALSHLSGLKDVQAAKQLEELAKSLQTSNDAELRQQGQIVLFGFAVQNLQNGVQSDPSAIVSQAKQLVADSRFRSRLEMTSLLHALRVFEQMGYHEQISPLQRVAFEAFSESGDKPLRFESWNQLVGAAPSREQLLAAMDTLGSPQFDGSAAIIAAQALLNDFPNAVTLEVLSEYVPTLEYAGHPTTSQQLVETIEHQSSKLPEGNSLMAIQSILNERKLRLSWAGRELGQLDLVDLNGKAVSQESLEGKVVLVQFWASWSLPCLRELPYLENCYGKLKAKGFEILSINMDSELNAMLAFIKEHPADWPIYRHSNNDIRLLTQQFGITMFPHSLLIDQTGKVLRVNLRGPEMETELVRLLGN